MIFANFNLITAIIFFIILIILIYFFALQIVNYRKNKIKKLAFFANISIIISLLILSIGIFNPKLSISSEKTYNGTNIVFALDVSKSMEVSDIKLNSYIFSRLNASKEFIKNFLKKHPDNRYSLVVFAGESIRVLPFTDDINLFSTILSGVDSNNVSLQGTDLVSALNSSLANFENENDSGLVVIISDGGEEELKLPKINENIEIITIGVGTLEGGKIPIGIDYFGNTSYKTYNGQVVVTKLNSSNLKQIANYYDGKYLELADLNDFTKIDKVLGNISKQVYSKNSYNYLDLSRYISIASFVFFILFLVFLILNNAKNKL